jgi:hypothetical protein
MTIEKPGTNNSLSAEEVEKTKTADIVDRFTPKVGNEHPYPESFRFNLENYNPEGPREETWLRVFGAVASGTNMGKELLEKHSNEVKRAAIDIRNITDVVISICEEQDKK